MFKHKVAGFAIFLCMPTIAFAEGQNTSAECNKYVESWQAAYNSHDAAALAHMYEAQSGRYSNPFWTAGGQQSLKAAFQQEFALKTHMTSIRCDSSQRYGDVNVASGTYAATAKGPSGADMPMQGHWSAIGAYRKDQLLITYHISNMQLPTGK